MLTSTLDEFKSAWGRSGASRLRGFQACAYPVKVWSQTQQKSDELHTTRSALIDDQEVGDRIPTASSVDLPEGRPGTAPSRFRGAGEREYSGGMDALLI